MLRIFFCLLHGPVLAIYSPHFVSLLFKGMMMLETMTLEICESVYCVHMKLQAIKVPFGLFHDWFSGFTFWECA